MDELPTEIILDILYKIDDLNVFGNMCKANSKIHQVCREYRVEFCKHFLEKFKVDYNDPTNFIYVQNNVSKKNYVKRNQGPDYCNLLLLYLNFYDEKKIQHVSSKTTSFPVYPNLKRLELSRCTNMKSLPDGMEKLEELKLEKTGITTLPESIRKNLTHLVWIDCGVTYIPKMEYLLELYCYNNLLTSIDAENIPRIGLLHCDHNQLTELPELPEINDLNCSHNQLRHLPSNMEYLDKLVCSNNQLTSLPDDLDRLTLLDCSNNQLRALPSNMTELMDLKCDNNQITSLPRGMNLYHLSCKNNPLTGKDAKICREEETEEAAQMYNDGGDESEDESEEPDTLDTNVWTRRG